MRRSNNILATISNDRPSITITLVTVVVALGLFDTLSPNIDLLSAGANNPIAIRTRGEVYRLLSAMFLHVGLLHVLLNANLLYLFGLSLERRIGHWRFLLIFLSGGLMGNVFHAFLESPDAIGVGVSGALYALIGADSVYLHRCRKTLTTPQKLYLYFIVALGGMGLIVGILTTIEGFPVAIQAGNWAHVGGLLVGLVMGYIMEQNIINRSDAPLC